MNTPAPVPRSNFVTVLAWVMIAFGALGVMMSVFQNVVFNLLLPALQTNSALPGFAGAFPFGVFRFLMLFGLAICVLMTYAAYALLKRRNWARILFIVLFIINAVMHVVVVVAFAAGFSFLGALPAGDELLPPEFRAAFSAMAIAIAVFMVVMGIGYAWLAYRLGTPAIAAEFRDPAATR